MTASVPAPHRTSVDIAIVGAGIGGMAAAVALRHAGCDPHVYERARVLKEVGGPLIVRAPSLRLLEDWGLEAFYRSAVEVIHVDLLDKGGQLLRTSPMDFQGDGSAYATHRADIHELLRGRGADRSASSRAGNHLRRQPPTGDVR